ncbi:MAG: RDD family protein [Candidatus Limnocylindrales bacterium]
MIRLVAYIVDGIVLLIPNAILGFIFLASAVTVSVSQSGARVGVDYGGLLVVTILELAISAAYFVYTWTRMRASPGDRLFGLMVLNAADGSPLTTNQALVRWVVLAGPSALSSLVTAGTGGLGALVGLLVLFWYAYLAWTTATDPRRQGFHDKYVGSVVVKATLL